MARPGRGLPLLALLLALGAAAEVEWAARSPLPDLCGDGDGGCCPGSMRRGSPVDAFCASRAGAAPRGRCCLLDGSVAGLDLGNCSLHQLCPDFQGANTAVVIDLTDNPLEHLPVDAFRGFTKLRLLALPLETECPGGGGQWDNVTAQGSSRVCQGQRNACNGSGELGQLCPEDSLCAPDGPGLAQCLCVGPYHGYKCLRQGRFPFLLFFGTLGAVTAALSVLLWATQRRKAKTS
uniref:All-trans retinoic acid induced differentiation factor n=1 Tax=Salvator merianae TaxID=96440 RepID=A0A8D0DQT6_SALMN